MILTGKGTILEPKKGDEIKRLQFLMSKLTITRNIKVSFEERAQDSLSRVPFKVL